MDKSSTRLETVKLVQRILDMTNEEFAGILGIAPTWWATIKNGKASLNGDHVLLIQDKYPELYSKAEKILSLNLHKPQASDTNNGGNGNEPTNWNSS